MCLMWNTDFGTVISNFLFSYFVVVGAVLLSHFHCSFVNMIHFYVPISHNCAAGEMYEWSSCIQYYFTFQCL